VIRNEVGLFVMIGALLVFGFAGIVIGYDQGAIQPFPFLVGLGFVGLGIYLLARTLSRYSSISGVPGVSSSYASERALLAKTVREFYMEPRHKWYNPQAPSDFDRQMLQLFDAIEAGAPDIHARIEAMRAYTRNKGFFGSYGERFKSRMVWRTGAAHLQWRPPSEDNWQLRINWNRMYRVGNSTFLGAEVTIPPSWLDPAPAALVAPTPTVPAEPTA
jgi:hypothetical protein